MPLPNIITPEFETIIPSNKQTIKFRPFLVKEEKILLMAQEGKDEKEITEAVVRILSNCILSQIDVTTLPLFDIEWLFLQLRSKSVNESIKLYITHAENKECNHNNEVVLKIDDIKVDFPKDHSRIIEIKDGVGLEMKYPDLNMITTSKFDLKNMNVEDTFKTIYSCVQNVFDRDNVYSDFTQEELNDFINNLSQPQFEKIIKFFETMPKLRHTLKFKCAKCGEEVKHELNSLTDFFL